MPDVALSGGQSSSFRSDPYNVDQRGFLNDIVVCSLFLLLCVRTRTWAWEKKLIS